MWLACKYAALMVVALGRATITPEDPEVSSLVHLTYADFSLQQAKNRKTSSHDGPKKPKPTDNKDKSSAADADKSDVRGFLSPI